MVSARTSTSASRRAGSSMRPPLFVRPRPCSPASSEPDVSSGSLGDRLGSRGLDALRWHQRHGLGCGPGDPVKYASRRPWGPPRSARGELGAPPTARGNAHSLPA